MDVFHDHLDDFDVVRQPLVVDLTGLPEEVEISPLAFGTYSRRGYISELILEHSDIKT